MVTVAVVLILAGFGVYVMTPEERVRLLRGGIAMGRHLVATAIGSSRLTAPFHDELRRRTRWPVVTVAMVATNVVVFGFMLVSPGSLSDPETLIGWGANFAPRTTNGEWWRLVTSLFVHAGVLHLFATLIALIPLGLILERLVGHVAFATVFLAAGVLTGLGGLSASPLAVFVGPSASTLGAYGLLIASLLWGFASRSAVSVPWSTIKKIAGAAAVFVMYNLATDHVQRDAEVAGLIVGLIGGLVMARGVGHEKPPRRRILAAMVATLVMLVASALPVRGTTDVRPELVRVVAFESRSRAVYDAAVGDFRKGWINARSLANTIDQKIVPELRAARTRFERLRGRIPREHKALVSAAHAYFALREESWRCRADALRKMSSAELRDADRVERASLEAFEAIRPMGAAGA